MLHALGSLSAFPAVAEGVSTAPPLEELRLGCPFADTAGGRCLLCALTQERVQIEPPRHIEVVQLRHIVI